jgi:ubiquinone/menaquinone biosynthesis C-methylase UbiE
MAEIDLLFKYPKSKRPIEERKNTVTEEMRNISRKFDFEYFDGDRMYGYGGYNYNPKFWTETTKIFYNHYKMYDEFKILDVGCGKGFMIYDFLRLYPQLKITGLDISEYAIKNAKKEVKHLLQIGNAINLPFDDNSFDLIISINTIHNLNKEDLKKSLKEFLRVSKNTFITVDAWHNDEEKKRMLSWNLTALTYMHVDDWKFLFKQINYNRDYFWFIP